MDLLTLLRGGKLDALYLSNFKAFGELQRIPLRPITLLFGPNSSGKSSIIQSLAMAHESLFGRKKRHQSPLDVHRTDIGGDSIDLGGFLQYVHCGQYNQQVILGYDITGLGSLSWGNRIAPFLDSVSKISIVIAIGLKLNEEGEPLNYDKPRVDSIEIKVDGKKLIRMCEKKDDEVHIDFLASDHDFFQSILKKIIKSAVAPEKIQVKDYDVAAQSVATLLPKIRVSIDDLLPTGLYHEELDDDWSYSDNQMLPIRTEDRQYNIEQAIMIHWPRMVQEFILSSSKILAKNLECFQYLGPLRAILQRHLVFAKFDSDIVGSDGAYAWREMDRNAKLRDKINSWLGSDKLKTPYELKTRSYVFYDSKENNIKPANEKVRNPLPIETVLLDKRTGTIVTHRDVGIGISQVLPVLVMAYESGDSLVAIEQPEIHLHPALQSELGDVFIESALGESSNTFILETHSEHLMLRIMRRMRETAEGTLPDGIPAVRPDDVMVLYVEPDGPRSIVREMPLNERGELVKAWPGGFFEEGLREMF